MTKQSNDWASLEVYVETLLRDGKRSSHPDFQTLFRIFGQDRISDMAREILKRLKEEKGESA